MRRTWKSLGTAAALLLLPAIASAAAVPGARLWLEAFGSWNTYAMGDVNDDIASINEGLAGSGLSLDKIRDGFGLGARAGMDFSRLAFGLGFERCSAASDWGFEGVGMQFRFPANALYGLAEMRFRATRPVAARLGVAGGIVSLSPGARVGVTGDEGFSFTLTGHGPLFEVYGTGEWWATPQVAVVGSAGYRYARVSDPRVDDLWTLDGYTIDYGGLQARAGVRFALIK